MLLASSINLAPDATALPMFGIFLFVLIVLTVFVFRPVLKILDARRFATEGARDRAVECDATSDRLDEEISRTTADARSRGALVRAEQRHNAEATAREILDSARAETSQLLAKAETERALAKKNLAEELDKQLPIITEMIAAHARFEDKAATK